ncbi:MAG: hypothetical protein WAN36_03070 [Calditrichia bacterium]
MTTVWEKVKKNLVDSLNIAIDKTEEMTSIGRIKMEMLQIEHRLDEKYAELGKYVNNLILDEDEEVKLDPMILNLHKDITKLITQLRAKEKDLGRIKEEDGIDLDSY